MEYLPITFEINGRAFVPLSDEERERQVGEIKRRHKEVDAFFETFDDSDEDQCSEVLAQCITSFEFWCEHFAYTFDPRDIRNPHKRFILYDYQREAARKTIACILEGRDQLEEKSRDMGASWLKMAIFTWMWTFWESFHALVGSRKEDLVDDYTVDSLFGKIDYMVDRMPRWMVPGYDDKKNRKLLRIEHPCGNLISGESANPNFGRGPRKNVVYFDEYAFTENDRAIWTSIADTAPCKLVTSTPQGMNNQFAILRFQVGSGIEILTLHWTLHPLKDVEWYEREKKKRKGNTVTIAQELDINYQASAGGLVLDMMEGFRDLIIISSASPQDAITAESSFYGGLDWGSTNPTSFHVYRVQKLREFPTEVFAIQSVWEYYEPSSLVKLGPVILSCPYYNLLKHIYSDPTMWSMNQQTTVGVTSLAQLFMDEYKIFLTPGSRGDTYALEQLKLMWADPDDIRFHISMDCPNQWEEFKGLRTQTQSSYMDQRRNRPEALVDKDNHSWDDFKYFFNSRFKAPLKKEPEKPPLMGFAALNQDIGTLRGKKIQALIPQRGLRRIYSRKF